MRAAIYVLVAAALFQEGRAFADDDELAKPASAEAREHLTIGARHYRGLDYEQAISEYKAGILIEDSPVFYLDLAQAYRKLGRCEEAIWNYQHFLDHTDPLPLKYKDLAEGFIRECKTKLDQKPIANPATLTLSAHVDPWYEDGVGWTITGAGAVAGGVALWLFLDAKSLDDQANTEPNQDMQNTLRNRASDRKLAGSITGVVGAIGFVAGIVKLAIAPSAQTSSTALNVGVSRDSIFVIGRF